MTAYYNENDPKAAAWLRELIKGGHIAQGDVDERSIEDVAPIDLDGYTQCHFFAGIGGWSYALRLAGWSDDRPVWTGSCPCQPFSAAGKGKGFADERHLWPAWFHLIRICRPTRIFGEQVANALPWIDLVSTDLEGEDYTTDAVVMGAHSVGAPHIRQRLYWVAESCSERRDGQSVQLQPRESRQASAETSGGGATSGLAHTNQGQRGRFADGEERERDWAQAGRLQSNRELESSSPVGGLVNTNKPGPQGRSDAGSGCADQRSPWAASDFIECRDGKRRPTQPGIFPLAHGVPGRVGLLRGYGNAIVPQVAAAFIEACMT
jgi:DNA (cytosine-5)-methyltransferase 1